MNSIAVLGHLPAFALTVHTLQSFGLKSYTNNNNHNNNNKIMTAVTLHFACTSELQSDVKSRFDFADVIKLRKRIRGSAELRKTSDTKIYPSDVYKITLKVKF